MLDPWLVHKLIRCGKLELFSFNKMPQNVITWFQWGINFITTDWDFKASPQYYFTHFFNKVLKKRLRCKMPIISSFCELQPFPFPIQQVFSDKCLAIHTYSQTHTLSLTGLEYFYDTNAVVCIPTPPYPLHGCRNSTTFITSLIYLLSSSKWRVMMITMIA
jgi:hypothetical protein